MTSDQALALIVGMIQTTLMVAGPLLGAALIGGVLVGIIQTATQVNEASIAFVVKGAAVIGVMVFAGSALADQVITYTKTSIASVADVVK